MAVLDDRRSRDDLVLPLDVVDVDLHDLEVWYGGAEMRADQTAEMAVETDIHQIPVRFGRFSAQSARTTTKFERWLIAPAHIVARVDGVGALSPTRVAGYVMRTYSGRPSSSIRFSTSAAMAMCGRPPRCKEKMEDQQLGQVRSCVRPRKMRYA